MALTGERDTARRDTESLQPEVAAGARIFKGALVALQGGYAVPGATATNLIPAGRAEESVDNSGGSAGALRVKVRRGQFLFKNFATDPVLRAHVGADCFIVDDETVAATHGGNTRSRAGKVLGLEDANGVWVEIR